MSQKPFNFKHRPSKERLEQAGYVVVQRLDLSSFFARPQTTAVPPRRARGDYAFVMYGAYFYRSEWWVPRSVADAVAFVCSDVFRRARERLVNDQRSWLAGWNPAILEVAMMRAHRYPDFAAAMRVTFEMGGAAAVEAFLANE